MGVGKAKNRQQTNNHNSFHNNFILRKLLNIFLEYKFTTLKPVVFPLLIKDFNKTKLTTFSIKISIFVACKQKEVVMRPPFAIYPLYCGGEFIETSQVLEVTCSYDGQKIGSTFLAGEPEVNRAIEAAEKAFLELKTWPSHRKFKVLSEISNALAHNRKEIASILALEACKPLRYALAEVDRATQTFYVAAEEAKRIPAEYVPIDWTPAGENKEGLLKYFPIGPVAGISPFNFPLNLTAHKVAPAIAAGCPIVLKPASATPLTNLMLAKIIDNTELPKGTFSVLPMSRETGNILVTDTRFKLLTFTGSSEVGWEMKNNAGKKRVVLELGGNAGVIVTETADISDAVAKCLTSGFAYSGQVCIHTQRILVEKSIFDAFCSRFTEKVKALVKGDPLDENTQISSMINQANAKRVEQWIIEAQEAGAVLLTGGKRDGCYVEPTVLTNTNPSMKVNTCEVFGPVVIIEPYACFKEAVAEVNNTEYGLQAGVFTDKLSEMNYAFDHIEVGGLLINDTSGFRVDHMPYGGTKSSGVGREGVKYAIHDMLEPKLLVKNLR